MPQQSNVTTDVVSGGYSRFVVHKRHVIEPNVIMLPVCKQTPEGDDQDEVAIQLAPPQHRLIVSFEAEKLGQVPHIPDPDPPRNEDGVSNLVLLKFEISPVSIIADGSGQAVRYTVSGEYTYGYKNWKTGRLNAALPPWMENVPETYNAPFKGNADIVFPEDNTLDDLTAYDVVNDALAEV